MRRCSSIFTHSRTASIDTQNGSYCRPRRPDHLPPLTRALFSPNQGRQARSKQSDPAPLADGGRAHPGAPERKGKRKLVAEAKAERAGPAAAASPRANKRVKQDGRAAGGGGGGAAAAAAGKGKGKEQKKQAAKPKNGREVDWESDDDIEGLKADDDMSDDEELDDEEQKRLASARSYVLPSVGLSLKIRERAKTDSEICCFL